VCRIEVVLKMVVPYDKPKMMGSRYHMLSPSLDEELKKEIIGKSDNGQNYATFMKSLHTEKNDRVGKSPQRTPRLTAKLMSTSIIDGSPRKMDMTPKLGLAAPTDVVTLNAMKQKNAEDYEKKMKAVESNMIVHRQQERELKRQEREILNREKGLEKAMRSYEKDINAKKLEQEKEIVKEDREVENIRNKYNIVDEKLTRSRTDRNMEMIQKEKEKESKARNTLNGITFEVKDIAEAIELKRIEVQRLAAEFAAKMQAKEEEEYLLKKKYAELTVELNAEDAKRRVMKVQDEKSRNKANIVDIKDERKRTSDLESELRQHGGQGVAAEKTKRKLSVELQGRSQELSQHKREEARRMMDTKASLSVNAANQKRVRNQGEETLMERQAKFIDEKIQTVNIRKQKIVDQLAANRKQKNDLSTDTFRQRNFIAYHDQKNETLKDAVSHHQKNVSFNEAYEQSLYNTVRQAESMRKSKAIALQQQNDALLELKRKNQLLIKETMLKCAEEERVLQQKLIREHAQLEKLHSQREQSIQQLVNHRVTCSQDRYMLEEESKNQQRIQRILEKTNNLQEQSMQIVS